MPAVPTSVFDLHEVLDHAELALTGPHDEHGPALLLTPGHRLQLAALHCPIGRRAVPEAQPFHDRPSLELAQPVVLPLRAGGDPLDSLLAVIYRGVAHGHHWLALTADDGTGSVGFTTVPTMEGGAPPDAKLIPARVALDLLGPVDAVIPKGYTWNGWDCPSFALPAVRELAGHFAAQRQDPDYTVRIDIDGDAVTLVEQAGTDEEQRTVYTPDPTGRYPLGSWAWVWSAVELPTVRQLPPPDHRLWFPWRDVQALAAHADALDCHRPVVYTNGETSTGYGLRLDVVDDAATLTSTGEPGWHDRWGRPHTVTDRRIRRIGQPAHPTGTRPAMIRLRDRFHRLVPDRRVPDRSAAWLIVEVWLDLPGMDGIPLTRCQPAHERDDLDPATTTWTPANVTCREIPGHIWPAQVAEDLRCGAMSYLARFDAATVARMVADTAPHVGRPGAVWVQKTGITVCVYRSGGHDNRQLLMSWVHPDADGRYPIGAHQLTWTISS